MKRKSNFFGSIFRGSSKKDDASENNDRDSVPHYNPSIYKKKIKVGDRIGGHFQVYQILGGEGKSGMGIVYVCYDNESKKVFALKTFQERYLSSKSIRDCFKNEALSWTLLEKHPYIVQAIGVQELDNRLFIGLEYIAPDSSGRNTLTHYLQSNISFQQTLEWGIQFCHGMEYACSKGVTPHRDIKPDNIMIISDGWVKITDFGLAKLWDKTDIIKDLGDIPGGNKPGLSFIKRSDGMLGVGTPPWMAPEQFEGTADVRSDIYSFGIVLYQMVNHGVLPFDVYDPSVSDKENYDAFHNAHKNAPVPRINSVLFPVIKRCLEKNRCDRYHDFKDLRLVLEKLYWEETGKSPPSPPIGLDLKAWEYCNKGVSLSTLGLHDEAIIEYNKAIQLKPDDAVVYNNLGSSLSAKGLLDEAITASNKAIQLKPDFAEAYYNLGAILSDKGLLDEAIIAYKKTVQIKPSIAEAYYNLGGALFRKGLLDEAITAYNKAIQLKPDYAKAYYNLGAILSAKGLLDEAITAYNKVIQLKPDFAEAYYNLGAILSAKGLLDEAIIVYKKTIQLKPDYAEAYYNLGNALKDKGFLDESITSYNKAIRLKPDDAAAYHNLGMVYSAVGHFNLAIKAYQNFLKYASPKYAQYINYARQQIQELEKKEK